MEVVTQRNTYDCVLACLAMATGKEYETLWPEDFRLAVEEAHGTSRNGLHEKAFEISGLVRDVDYKSIYCGSFSPTMARNMLWGRRAFVQVPSLNHKGEMHYVYWDGEELHDPSTKHRYQWLDHISPEWVVLLRSNK